MSRSRIGLVLIGCALAAPPMVGRASEPQVVLADGEVLVPDFRGMTIMRARREARRVGLKLRERDSRGRRFQRWLAGTFVVAEQRTSAGSKLTRGSEIDLVLSFTEESSGGY